eukprot:TRINITY_DN24003_c0_g1_i1.p1 TRINITY_DN24003_c0_g1~~TRINITY_DN24003_c0_g1_i1.p1  ORF type:complete len:453 (+),score=67.49 TRINITY_DN24003_c0_g1_i1:81-1439(+)
MVRLPYAGLAGARESSRELHTEAARSRTVNRLRKEGNMQLAKVNEPGLYEATPKDEDGDTYLMRLGFIHEDAPPLLRIAVAGHEPETIHGEGSSACNLYEIHCQLSPVGVSPGGDDESAWRSMTQWRCKRRLCDIRSDLHERVKKKLGSEYAGWFRKAPFASSAAWLLRGVGGKSNIDRLTVWFEAFADYFNAAAVDKKTKVQWLRFLGAPGKPRKSRAGSGAGSGYTSATSSRRPSLTLTSRANVLISRGRSPYGSRQGSAANTPTLSRANSRGLSRASSFGSLSGFESDKGSLTPRKRSGSITAATPHANVTSAAASSAGYPVGSAIQQVRSLGLRGVAVGYGAGSHPSLPPGKGTNAEVDINSRADRRTSPQRLPELREESENDLQAQQLIRKVGKPTEEVDIAKAGVSPMNKPAGDAALQIDSEYFSGEEDLIRLRGGSGVTPVRVLL